MVARWGALVLLVGIILAVVFSVVDLGSANDPVVVTSSPITFTQGIKDKTVSMIRAALPIASHEALDEEGIDRYSTSRNVQIDAFNLATRTKRQLFRVLSSTL